LDLISNSTEVKLTIKELEEFLTVIVNTEEFCRNLEALNYIEELYIQSNTELMEELIVTFIKKLLYNHKQPLIVKFQAIELLQTISLRTDNKHFNEIINILVNIVINYNKAFTNHKEGLSLAYETHSKLFYLFKHYYLQYPSNKLISVLKSLLQVLNCKNYEILLLILKFLRHISF
jgi:SHS2 domain-containing protein